MIAIMPPRNDGLDVRFGRRRDHPQVLDGLREFSPGRHAEPAEDAAVIELGEFFHKGTRRRLSRRMISAGGVWPKLRAVNYTASGLN